jgi:hypothetical protein
MDLHHGGTVEGFCLVSLDGDFTRFATRIREAGLAAYGFRERKTPKPFVAACDKYVFTVILGPAAADSPGQSSPREPLQPGLSAAVSAAAREDGWAALSAAGSLSIKANPSFDPLDFGFKKLGALAGKRPFLQVKSVPAGDGSPNVHLYVRVKDSPPPDSSEVPATDDVNERQGRRASCNPHAALSA